jgi:hypothetical protein
LKTSKDLKDDMKKGQHKVKALIRCFKDSDKNKLWWTQTLKGTSSDGHFSCLGDSNQFCFLLMECQFQPLIALFVFFSPHAKTNKELQWKRQCNISFHKKQMIFLVLFNDIIHLRQSFQIWIKVSQGWIWWVDNLQNYNSFISLL